MLEFRNVRKTYPQGHREVTALDGVDLTIEDGEFVAVMGPSGSGKSTLLHLAGGLDVPTAGEIRLDGVATHAMDDDRLTQLRLERIGFVFQFFNLMPTLSVLENTALPLLLAGRRLADVRGKAEMLLDRVGLLDRATHRPEELSGGQMQRVAVARALITEPSLILADEPTGNLDSASGAEVLAILAELGRGRTIIMVTHDQEAAKTAKRTIRLRDGRVE